ncbi:hypothetical protein HRbin04_01246 [archaeon HR04]|nr:hypothetical protein HRbin04_01246 [archaeon HR04]
MLSLSEFFADILLIRLLLSLSSCSSLVTSMLLTPLASSIALSNLSLSSPKAFIRSLRVEIFPFSVERSDMSVLICSCITSISSLSLSILSLLSLIICSLLAIVPLTCSISASIFAISVIVALLFPSISCIIASMLFTSSLFLSITCFSSDIASLNSLRDLLLAIILITSLTLVLISSVAALMLGSKNSPSMVTTL